MAVVVVDTPFNFKPLIAGGFNYALIATQAPVPTDLKDGRNVCLRDTLPAPPADVKNWKEYLNFINNDTSTAYYNVSITVIAVKDVYMTYKSSGGHRRPQCPYYQCYHSSPCRRRRQTRFELQNNHRSMAHIPSFNDLLIYLLQNSSMPHGTLASLSSPSGLISLQKTILLENSDVGVHVSLDPGFDDIITLTVYPPSGIVIEPFAWVSLQASIVASKPSVSGGIPISNVYLLGAQNIVFHNDATTNLRFASPAANKLKKYVQITKDEGKSSSSQSITAVNAARTSFSATGWWFRDALNDTNIYPRTENVYLRGNCTLGNEYKVETCLFCIPNNLLLYPTNYAQYSVNDFNDKGNPYVATRTITLTSTNSFNVLDLAFDILNPQSPPPGSDHYCLIVETRHPTSENPDPDWPHEDTGAFSSCKSPRLHYSNYQR